MDLLLHHHRNASIRTLRYVDNHIATSVFAGGSIALRMAWVSEES